MPATPDGMFAAEGAAAAFKAGETAPLEPATAEAAAAALAIAPVPKAVPAAAPGVIC